MKLSVAFLSLSLLASQSAAFTATAPGRSTTALRIVPGDKEDVVEKTKRLTKAYKEDPKFDKTVKKAFPKALTNAELENRAVEVLAKKGYTSENTLLCTSLCCDELARKLEDEFVAIYGDNFNLGGLSGFPFAGNTGFGAMAAVSFFWSCCVICLSHLPCVESTVLAQCLTFSYYLSCSLLFSTFPMMDAVSLSMVPTLVFPKMEPSERSNVVESNLLITAVEVPLPLQDTSRESPKEVPSSPPESKSFLISSKELFKNSSCLTESV